MGNLIDIILTPESTLPLKFVVLCKSVTAKRARTVIDHILKHGVITNEDLSKKYGYDHPPRAIRDVRENGIPLITHQITSPKTGRRIGAYTFDKVANVKRGRIGGRKAFSKSFKQNLIQLYGSKDAFTGEKLHQRYLQIDHRVPYEVAGEASTSNPQDYMLLDGSSQRAKSWSCENCENLKVRQNITLCKTCFWAAPESYTHIALEQKRRIDLIWSGDEVKSFDKLKAKAGQNRMDLGTFIKHLLLK